MKLVSSPFASNSADTILGQNSEAKGKPFDGPLPFGIPRDADKQSLTQHLGPVHTDGLGPHHIHRDVIIRAGFDSDGVLESLLFEGSIKTRLDIDTSHCPRKAPE